MMKIIRQSAKNQRSKIYNFHIRPYFLNFWDIKNKTEKMRSLLLMSFSELGKAGSDTFASTNVQQDLKFGWMLSNVSTTINKRYDSFLETSLNWSLTQINFLNKIRFLIIIYIEKAIIGLSQTIFIASSNQ